MTNLPFHIPKCTHLLTIQGRHLNIDYSAILDTHPGSSAGLFVCAIADDFYQACACNNSILKL